MRGSGVPKLSISGRMLANIIFIEGLCFAELLHFVKSNRHGIMTAGDSSMSIHERSGSPTSCAAPLLTTAFVTHGASVRMIICSFVRLQHPVNPIEYGTDILWKDQEANQQWTRHCLSSSSVPLGAEITGRVHGWNMHLTTYVSLLL